MVELRFTMARPLRFMAKLKTMLQLDEQALERLVVSRTVRDLEAKFTVYLPERGEYGLEIYTNDPSGDGNTLFHIWQYLVLADVGSPVARAIPQLPSGYIGPQLRFAQSGLQPVNLPDPYVQTRNTELILTFAQSQQLRTTVQLLDAQGQDTSSFVLQQSLPQDNKARTLHPFESIHGRFWALSFFAILETICIPYMFSSAQFHGASAARRVLQVPALRAACCRLHGESAERV